MAAQTDIVVGLDGSPSAWRALDWAAEESEGVGARLVIVHAPRVSPSSSEGRQLLAHALARVGEDRPAVHATVRLGEGRPDQALVHDASDAGLVVLGRGRHKRSGEHLGTTARRVLAHASCPAVIVGGADRIESDSIVVGVSDSPGGDAALQFAAERARRLKTPLVAVRGVEAGDNEAAMLDAWLARAHGEHPDLEIRPVVTDLPAEEAIEREAIDASLVVLGCRRDDDAKVGRLGVLTAALARELTCPIAVVGHPRTPRAHAATRRVPAHAEGG